MSNISYSTDSMRATAQKIRANASTALSDHTKYWNMVQNCLSPLPGFVQSAFYNVLNPHDERLRASYQWQMEVADRLEQAANHMDGLDSDLTKSFQ